LWQRLSQLFSSLGFRIASAIQDQLHGDFFIGVDLGKKQDYSVVAVIRRLSCSLKLVYMKQFPLGTEYTSVIGYLKVLCTRLKCVNAVLVDQTGVGESVVEEARRENPLIQGLTLTMNVKMDLFGYLLMLMQQKIQCTKCAATHSGIQIPYDDELIAELHSVRYELTKSGQIMFSHPSGTHDDRVFALALGAYASRQAEAPVLIPIRKR